MDRRSGSSFSNGTATSPVRNSSVLSNGRLSSTTNGRTVLTPSRTSTSPTRTSNGNGTVRSPTRVSTNAAQSDRMSTNGASSPRGSSLSRARTPSASRMSSTNEDQMYTRREDVRGRTTTRSPVRNGSVLNTTVRSPTSRSPSPVRDSSLSSLRNGSSVGLTRTTAPRASSPTRVSTLGSRRSVGSSLPNAGTTTLAELRARSSASRASAARSPSRSPVRSPTRTSNGRTSSMRSPATSPVRNGIRSPSRSPVRSPTRASSMRSPGRNGSVTSPSRVSSGGNRDTNTMLVCMLNGFNLNEKIKCVMLDLKAGYKAVEGVADSVLDILSDLEDRKIFHELINANGLSAELGNLNGEVFTLFAPSDRALYKFAGGSTPAEAARNISNKLRNQGIDVKSWLLNYISPFNLRQSHLRSLIDQAPVLQTRNNNMHSVSKNEADDSILVSSARIESSGKARNGTVYLVNGLFQDQQ